MYASSGRSEDRRGARNSNERPTIPETGGFGAGEEWHLEIGGGNLAINAPHGTIWEATSYSCMGRGEVPEDGVIIEQ